MELTLELVDLTRGIKSDHPDLNTTDIYLSYTGFAGFQVGRFSNQWYGWNFDCGWGASGFQFDTPGYNNSKWIALWRIVATNFPQDHNYDGRIREVVEYNEDDEDELY